MEMIINSEHLMEHDHIHWWPSEIQLYPLHYIAKSPKFETEKQKNFLNPVKVTVFFVMETLFP